MFLSLHPPPHRQALQALEQGHLSPAQFFQWDIQFQIRQALEQGVQGDLAFQPCQRRAKAVMHAFAKCQVRVGLALQVEPGRFWKTGFIAVGRTRHGDDQVSSAERLAGQLAHLAPPSVSGGARPANRSAAVLRRRRTSALNPV
jgi:hypothetical protein